MPTSRILRAVVLALAVTTGAGAALFDGTTLVTWAVYPETKEKAGVGFCWGGSASFNFYGTSPTDPAACATMRA